MARKGKNYAQYLEKLAMTLTYPAKGGKLRYPTQQLGARQTAVWKFLTSKPMDFVGIEAPNQVVMLTASPVTPVWSVQKITTTTLHQCVFEQIDATYDTGEVEMFMNSYTTSAMVVPVYPATWNNNQYYYAPTADDAQLILQVSNFPSSMTADFLLGFPPEDFSIDGREQLMRVTATINVTGTITIPTPTLTSPWVRLKCIKMASLGNVPGVITVNFVLGNIATWTTYEAMFPFIENPALADLEKPLTAARTNACALLLSNSGPPMYRNGTLRAARVYSSDVNPFDPAQLTIAIGNVNERLFFDGKTQTGFYTFLAPTESSLRWSNYRTVAGSYQGYVYDLSDFQTVNVVSCNATADNGGLRFQTELALHVEAVTSSKVYDIGEPWIDKVDFDRVIVSASAIRPFTDNPLHPIIFGLGRNLLRAVMPWARPKMHDMVDRLADKISEL